MKGAVTSVPGHRTDPVTGKPAGHRGIDFRVPVGTPVKATGDGVVTRVGYQDRTNPKVGFGFRVYVRHANGRVSVYAHLSGSDRKVGDPVKRGDVIGASGNTGKSTGPHLHYEERLDGRAVSPTLDPAGVP